MPEQKTESENFNVVDRRRFTSEGERRPEVGSRPAAAPAPAPAPAAPTPPIPQPESEPARSARQAYERQGRRSAARKVDFEALVLSLSTSALYQLGLVEDPVEGRIPADLEAARHTIDMLAVLEEKTRGNLTPREAQVLEQVLYELRLAFVNLAGGQPPGAPRSKASP